ncbi:MAG: 2-C-methyl-D-erythritol 4-phosphate cytidylyltransferase [Propionibacteriaceae bacterium]|jgi:2-C-methyl-D-erythritol 4-phosphate cytidylyltransferase|nr:2-C-methyl-D-erythritol 4-phosphate cytidylyltransferase [Propionibacteriaceae bacterium]
MVHAIVVAAGAGVRLGAGIPKALRTVGGRPLVSRSVAALARGGVTRATVVHPGGAEADFRAALATAPIPVDFCAGGASRQDSVAKGLALVKSDLVLVHDAARALVPPEVVERVVQALRAGAVGVVPVISLVDSIRRVQSGASHVVDRDDYRVVQTPQGFATAVLAAAHQALSQPVTDDAAAVELLGHQIALVEGDRRAFKITDPLDLALAEVLAKEET